MDFFSVSSFQICRSKVTVKVIQVKNFGANGNASSQELYMLNMKALLLMVQKLRQMLKDWSKVTVKVARSKLLA